jgi:hypothetical protein
MGDVRNQRGGGGSSPCIGQAIAEVCELGGGAIELRVLGLEEADEVLVAALGV